MKRHIIKRDMRLCLRAVIVAVLGVGVIFISDIVSEYYNTDKAEFYMNNKDDKRDGWSDQPDMLEFDSDPLSDMDKCVLKGEIVGMQAADDDNELIYDDEFNELLELRKSEEFQSMKRMWIEYLNENPRSLKKELVPYDGRTRSIVCWGDSMTEGIGNDVDEAVIPDGNIYRDISYSTYPDVLGMLTGITTYNMGVSGATSEEIAIMQGGIEPEQDLSWYPTMDYDKYKNSDNYKGSILILEIGSNGGWYDDYNILIAQYNAMIEHSGCDYYIIVGDTDDPGTSIADISQTIYGDDGEYVGLRDTDWEAALREAYGEHFINMRTYLIENGLTDVGFTPTQEDEEMARMGCISTRLRADWTHFNAYGYYSQAMGIYKKGVSLGYWE